MLPQAAPVKMQQIPEMAHSAWLISSETKAKCRDPEPCAAALTDR
jgi:hypothetical protein